MADRWSNPSILLGFYPIIESLLSIPKPASSSPP